MPIEASARAFSNCATTRGQHRQRPIVTCRDGVSFHLDPPQKRRGLDAPAVVSHTGHIRKEAHDVGAARTKAVFVRVSAEPLTIRFSRAKKERLTSPPSLLRRAADFSDDVPWDSRRERDQDDVSGTVTSGNRSDSGRTQ